MGPHRLLCDSELDCDLGCDLALCVESPRQFASAALAPFPSLVMAALGLDFGKLATQVRELRGSQACFGLRDFVDTFQAEAATLANQPLESCRQRWQRGDRFAIDLDVAGDMNLCRVRKPPNTAGRLWFRRFDSAIEDQRAKTPIAFAAIQFYLVGRGLADTS